MHFYLLTFALWILAVSLSTFCTLLLSPFYLLPYTYRMYLKSLELNGFKSFGKKSALDFSTQVTAVVGPNGSGKSNTAEAFRFVLGEQSMKSLRGKRGEDLIWGGSQALPRSNRASVTLTFDNTKRLLSIDFDEVVIERTVYRDGTNEYAINGSKVRLKDVVELLSGANIGSSGHHIISQGEADRVLAATPRERKNMIEDALGLRVFQYKKEESTKKLAKTEENKVQVESLRRENAPHLKFLERQMRKLEKARELREELVGLYHTYLRREDEYLSVEKEELAGMRDAPERALRDAEKRVGDIRALLENAKHGDKESDALLMLEQTLSNKRAEVTNCGREEGRLEGQLSFEEERLRQEERVAREEEGKPIPYKDARDFWEALIHTLASGHARDGDIGPVHKALKRAQELTHEFMARHKAVSENYRPDTSTRDRLKSELVKVSARRAQAEAAIADLEKELEQLKGTIEQGKDQNRELERELFSLMAHESEQRSMLAAVRQREEALNREMYEFKREVSEGIALIGRAVMAYKDAPPEGERVDMDTAEPRSAQLDRKRELERLKIRLEEMGGASADEITKEYEEVHARDAFLERELLDLTTSAESLRTLIAELDRELSLKFAAGVEKVSAQFNEFFVLMFGGGSAELKVVEEKKRGTLSRLLLGGDTPDDDEGVEEEREDGLEVEVSLPKKRIQSLLQLSGGERALTSIALIFAMSQVNPPPFLILDETDAALDEANSRRYGDMIENLAKKSQLILITHNRETMSRAGILYGVTMGLDGVSKLLSVRFEDAVAVAK